MKIYDDGLTKELCDELATFALSYIFGRSDISKLGFPNLVKTRTNYCWEKDVIGGTSLVNIYHLENELLNKLWFELKELKILEENDELEAMVYVWTPGSYIPIHNDNTMDNRKVLTSYLNEIWDISYGGMFHYKNKDTDKWEMVEPKQGLLVFNDGYEPHFTTPVLGENLRVSLQMFSLKN
jgi:hypothetical protein